MSWTARPASQACGSEGASLGPGPPQRPHVCACAPCPSAGPGQQGSDLGSRTKVYGELKVTSQPVTRDDPGRVILLGLPAVSQSSPREHLARPPLSPKCLLSVCCGPWTKLNISAHGACMLLGGTGGEEEPSLRPSSPQWVMPDALAERCREEAALGSLGTCSQGEWAGVLREARMGSCTLYHRRVSTLLSVISGNTLPLLKVFLNHHALSGLQRTSHRKGFMTD